MTACSGEGDVPTDLKSVKQEMHRLMKEGKLKKARQLVDKSATRLKSRLDLKSMKRSDLKELSLKGCEFRKLKGDLLYISGDYNEATREFQIVKQITKALGKLTRSARAGVKAGSVEMEMGVYSGAEEELLEARATLRHLVQEGDTSQERMLSWTNMILSNLYLNLEQFQKSKEIRDQVTYKLSDYGDDAFLYWQFLEARFGWELNFGNPEHARQLIDEGAKFVQERPYLSPYYTPRVHYLRLLMMLEQNSDYHDALMKTMALHRKYLPENHPRYASYLEDVAFWEFERDSFQLAGKSTKQADSILVDKNCEKSTVHIRILLLESTILMKASNKNSKSAEHILEKAESLMKDNLPENHSCWGLLAINRYFYYYQKGDLKKAKTLLFQARKIFSNKPDGKNTVKEIDDILLNKLHVSPDTILKTP